MTTEHILLGIGTVWFILCCALVVVVVRNRNKSHREYLSRKESNIGVQPPRPWPRTVDGAYADNVDDVTETEARAAPTLPQAEAYRHAGHQVFYVCDDNVGTPCHNHSTDSASYSGGSSDSGSCSGGGGD